MQNTQQPEINPNLEHQEQKSRLEPIGVFIWDLAKILLLSLLVILPIRYFIFQPFVVQGNSMEPNFTQGDYLIIDEVSYYFKEPQRGQVVVLRYPRDPSQFFIKRLIGLPGERVAISEGKVTIFENSSGDAEVLHEDYLADGIDTFGQESVVLGPDQYFVLGDNRAASSDSRTWGLLSRKDIVGKVFIRILPFSKLGLFSTPAYSN